MPADPEAGRFRHMLKAAGLERERLMSELDRLQRNLRASESISRKMLGELQAEINERRRQERMKDNFLNTASHELRTPLTVIKGAMDNLRDGVAGEFTPEQMAYLDLTSRHVERLCHMIDDLLDLSRLESGRTRMSRGPLHVPDLIEQVVKDFEIEAGSLGVEILRDVPPDLPKAHADPEMIRRVVTNLLSNAMKFARGRITVQARHADEQKVRRVEQATLLPELIGVQITVTDDGPGIDAGNLKRLFQKFMQVHHPSESRGHRGSGLGLTICKEIVELHQGRIWAESRPGKGAGFHFVLPEFDNQVQVRTLIDEAVSRAAPQGSPVSLMALAVLNADTVRDAWPPEDFEQVTTRLRDEIGSGVLWKDDRIDYWPHQSMFVILLQSGQDGAQSVRRRVRTKIEDLFRCAPAGLPKPEFGVGVAIFPEHAKNPEALLNLARERIEPL
ncbi:MAG: hypothetical protein A3G34_10935 [Candidatus Lindowbacteria bacterium RIFCSPLOWO2_12_FULL_62_27]|nr:MAG: hypothetical protein A3G34_10935 [Candidatus Lindowbacteria bacterium RIFCSPLOWO2_12_FULL_62_27]